ncbi:hypothetical protein JXA48_03495 [Candidatus Woesearchaeota archaeon]|nr:hypothetical protein [Candidatus Woesearchaeota archaeon]
MDDPHDARTLVSRVIPQALYAAKGGKDYVDTEDMMIYTFGGKKLFDKVKSEIEEHMKNGETDAYNYQKYKEFTTKDGERLVPKDVVKFVDLWNSYLGMPEHFLTEKTKALSDSLQANYTVKIVPTGKYQPLKK